MAKLESSWRELAACQFIDPELFFPTKGGSADAPKRVCNTMCEVREQCLEGAMREEYGLNKSHRFGVRGGLVPNARYALALERGEYVGKSEWEIHGEVA
ncbi:WhiB family transcription factor [Mycobacterium phage CELFI]|uniref:WhiB family transcription factor n=1 Tax=Mycobacterium phage CELFI TaxID=2769359 RepID=A0A7G9V498_9CAUD|nr:WhiB family transcriptional regulator [Mycobacterium phage CELFI]QNO01104.1 WhiB family transcription factor [Mycobacterium phage CELFI]